MTMTAHPFVQLGDTAIGEVVVEVVHGPSATIATVDFDGHTAVGEAKRMPTDEHSDEVARCLAVGRALETLADSLVRYGMARSHVLARD